MKVVILGSGSKGNCTYIETKTKKILIDAGLSLLQVRNRLAQKGIIFSGVDLVLITHEHIDHIHYLSSILNKTKATLCINEATFHDANRRLSGALTHERVRFIKQDMKYTLDELSFIPLALSHDATNCYGFVLREETEDALQLLADWYKDGLIHPDFIAGVETSKLYTGGQLGYMTDSRYQDPTVSSSRIASIRQRTPSAKEAFALPPKGPDGLRGTRIWGVACHVASFGKTEGYGAKVPRMLQMFEGMFTDDALMTQVRLGEENKHYVNVDGAATQSMYTWDMTPEYRDGNERRLAGLAGSFNGPSFFSPIAPKDELYTNTLSDAYKTWIDTYTSEDAVLHDAFFKVDVIASAADYMEDLRNKQMKLISDIIQGTKPADQYIEEFTKLWNSGGGEEMLAEAREYQDTVEQIYKELKIK